MVEIACVEYMMERCVGFVPPENGKGVQEQRLLIATCSIFSCSCNESMLPKLLVWQCVIIFLR